jgi:hypothetical protein
MYLLHCIALRFIPVGSGQSRSAPGNPGQFRATPGQRGLAPYDRPNVCLLKLTQRS